MVCPPINSVLKKIVTFEYLNDTTFSYHLPKNVSSFDEIVL